jgi:hypothetical protein
MAEIGMESGAMTRAVNCRYAFAALAAVLLGALTLPARSQSFTRESHTIQRDQQMYPGGTRVLIIGVSHYANSSVWPDLKTDRDIKRIHDLFIGRGLKEADIMSADLSGGRSLMDAINAFAKKLPAEDPRDHLRHGLRLFVYFAGHGYSKNNNGYLVPSNAPDPSRVSSDLDLRSVLIPQLEFLQDIASLNATATLVLLDACFSGLGVSTMQSQDIAMAPILPDEPQRVFQIITAGQANKTVPDDNVFSELVAAGLNGAADLDFDGVITGTELGEYLKVRMTEESIRAGRVQQTPLFETYVGDDIKHTVRGEIRFASPQTIQSQVVARATGQTSEHLRAFRDCPDCPELRIVPRPPDPGNTGSGYLAVGVMDVTVEEYEACFRSGGCRDWPKSATAAANRKPVTDVSLNDARHYARWLSCVTGKVYRLPTGSEWVHLAEPEANRMKTAISATSEVTANCRGCGSAWDGREAAPVGSFRAGDFGLYDLLGNVWQWVDNCGGTAAAGALCEHPAQVRGGAFTTRRGVVASLPSGELAPDVRDSNIGFRVARDLDAVTTLRGNCANGTDSP